MFISDENLKPEANNFTVVRLILASLVIYTHSYWLIMGVAGKDDLSDLLGAPVSVFAVDGFFFLSGFLVYPSLMRLRNSARFLGARATRLWPALVVSIVATVAGGALVTTAPGLSYLKGETAKFILKNITFLQGSFNLTGVRCGTELCVANGSLWTLPWEARCYLLLAVLGVIGMARPAMMKWVVLPLTLVCAMVWDIPWVQQTVQAHLGSGVVFQLSTADRLWPLFALGAAAYLFRERLRLSWLILGLLFVLMLAASRVGFGLHVRALFIGYLVLCLGLLTARTRVVSGRWPDYSYGMYIYAFPVMMVVHAWAPIPSYAVLGLMTFAGTLPLAALSWHFVEKPALEALKRRRARRTATAPQAA